MNSKALLHNSYVYHQKRCTDLQQNKLFFKRYLCHSIRCSIKQSTWPQTREIVQNSVDVAKPVHLCLHWRSPVRHVISDSLINCLCLHIKHIQGTLSTSITRSVSKYLPRNQLVFTHNNS